MRVGDWLQTFTTQKVYPLDPDPAEIDIADVGHALSNLCRFGGHTKRFYSVAEHCCHVHDLLPSHLKRAGLLHDASEAYLIDLPRPLKRSPGFGEIYLSCEHALMCCIAEKFGFDWPMDPTVEAADEALLAAEAHSLMSPLHRDWPLMPMSEHNIEIRCWVPERAWREFMTRYIALPVAKEAE